MSGSFGKYLKLRFNVRFGEMNVIKAGKLIRATHCGDYRCSRCVHLAVTSAIFDNFHGIYMKKLSKENLHGVSFHSTHETNVLLEDEAVVCGVCAVDGTEIILIVIFIAKSLKND